MIWKKEIGRSRRGSDYGKGGEKEEEEGGGGGEGDHSFGSSLLSLFMP